MPQLIRRLNRHEYAALRQAYLLGDVCERHYNGVIPGLIDRGWLARNELGRIVITRDGANKLKQDPRFA